MTEPTYTRAPLDLHRNKHITPVAVCVYLELAARIGRRRSWTGSQAALADAVHVTPRSIRAAVQLLAATGYITTDRAGIGAEITYALPEANDLCPPEPDDTWNRNQTTHDTGTKRPMANVVARPVVPSLPVNSEQTRSDRSESGSDTGAREEQDSEVGDDPIRMPGMPPAGYDELRQMSGLPVRRLLDAIRDELDARNVTRRDAEEMRELAQHLTAEDCDEIRRISDGKPWAFAYSCIGRAAADRRRGRDPWEERARSGAGASSRGGDGPVRRAGQLATDGGRGGAASGGSGWVDR